MIDISNYLRLNPTDMILVLISTLIICLLAKKYFWQNVLNYFDNRKKIIQDELDAAKAAQAEGEAYKQQYAQQLKGAREEARGIIEEARTAAKSEGNEIVNKAKQEAKLQVEKAQRDIAQEKLKAEEEIKKEITEVAFMAASKILEKEIDEESQQKYVEDFIERKGA